MIRVSVLIENSLWKKKIKNPKIYFNKIVNNFPKKYKFLDKTINLTLLLSNNLQLKQLNKKFRNNNKPTDVLSFPAFDKNDIKKNFKKKSIYIGDIIISYEFIFGEKFIKNKNILINTFIHGFLHLLGFDHKIQKDYKIMKKEEKKIINYINK